MKSHHGLLTASTTLVALTGVAVLAVAQEEQPPPLLGSSNTAEVRANTYTYSSQEDPAIAVNAKGRILATWSSRRQELGTYGVFAQLLDPLGRPLGTEMHLNQTLPGAQQDSCAAFAPDGSAWVCWSSMDRRAEGNGVFLRKLDFAAGGFQPVDEEILVAGGMDDLYTDPALAVNAEGELLITWVSNGLNELWIEACRVSPEGKVGESFRLSEADDCMERMPDVAALPDGRFLAVWQRADQRGHPGGIFARLVGEEGAEGEELSMCDPSERDHVEPSLDVDGKGRLLMAWMSCARDGGDYEVRARRYDAKGQPLGDSFAVEAGGEGYRNGALVVCAPDGRFLVAYNAHSGVYTMEDGRPARQVDIRAREYGSEGDPIAEAYRVNQEGPGRHALRIAGNGRCAAWSGAGPLVFSWAGTSEGDGSGIAVRIFAPEGFEAPMPLEIEPMAACADLSSKDMERKAPPEPLPAWRRRLGRVPGAGVDSAFGFVGHDQTGWTPPDPDLAVGPECIVSQVNCEIAAHKKDGTLMWESINYGSGGFWEALGAEDFVFDPIDVYDWHSGRFIVANSELASDGDYICLAVSKDSYPDDVDDWWKFRYKTTPAGNFPDFPNLGVGRDYITVTTDCFGGGGNRVMIFDKAAAMSGALTAWNQQMDASLQSLGSVKNYDTTNGYMYFVGGTFNSGNQIRIQCKRTPTASPDSHWVSVTYFDDPNDARQQGSSNRLDAIDCRIKNGVVRDGKLYAAHGIGSGSETVVRWYEIDLRGWPASGNSPLLLQEGELSLGSGIYSWFPDVHADSLGNVTVGYNRSASIELPSTEASWRLASDPPGTMPNLQSLVTSSVPYTGSRYGDYSGVDEDPAAPGTFWHHAEYCVGPWETWIDKWEVAGGSPVVYCTAKLNSQFCTPAIGFSGVCGFSQPGAFDISASQIINQKNGLLFYSTTGPLALPFQGAFLCAQPPLKRTTVQNSGGNPPPPDCSGTYSFDFNAWLLSGADPGLAAGTKVWSQYWYRDPGEPTGFTTGLTDALSFTVGS